MLPNRSEPRSVLRRDLLRPDLLRRDRLAPTGRRARGVAGLLVSVAALVLAPTAGMTGLARTASAATGLGHPSSTFSQPLAVSGNIGGGEASTAGVTIAVDGSLKSQTMSSLGVNINPNSWDNGNLKPALDLLIDQEGVKTFRVAMDMIDWESTNDNGDPFTFNWDYYNPIYSGQTSFDTRYAGSNFANLWNTIDYLHQKGIPDSGIMLSFMGIGPSWMGGATLNPAMEDEYVETVLSAAYYGYTHGHTFGLLSPDNEEDISHNEGITMSSALYADTMNRLAVRMNALGMTGVRLIGPETCCAFDPSAMMSNPTLMSKLDHFDLHDYTGSTQGASSDIAGSGKDFWMTEYNQFDQSFSLLDQGASGLMVWEAYDSVYNHAILNGLGSQPGNDSYGNTALISYDSTTKTYAPRRQFYEFGQLFKFAPIGSQRISASSGNTSVKVEAFQDPATSRLTMVGQNNSSGSQALTISLNNLSSVPTALQYYQTNSGSNLARGSDVPVYAGTAAVTVPAGTTFTLTGLGVTDTTAPSPPGTLTASGGVGSASLTWGASTDDVGVTGYTVYRSTTPGFTLSAATKVGQSATAAYADSGLAAGTYYYLVTAQDAAGNSSPPSNEALATTAADTTSPTVLVTSPAAGATVSGIASVAASASDNVGVAGVQFKLDGANLGSEVVTAPFAASWDTTKAPSGSHVLSAVARDAAGNTAASSPVTVTINNVASGTVLLGLNSIQSSADGDSAGEAEAFKFTAAATGQAGTLVFYVDSGSAATALKVGLYSDSSGKPGTLLASGSLSSPKASGWNTVTLGSKPILASGTPYWIAVLGTGGQLNYRDAATGSCSQTNSTSGLLSLPSTWSSGTSWPSCGLSAYVSAAATADITAPTVPAGLTAAPSGMSSISLAWTASTDDVAVAGYHVWRGGVLVATTTVSGYTDTGLTPATAYSYAVSAFDAAGNESAQSAAAGASTSADLAPPTGPTGLTQSGAAAASATLSWSPSTDNVGVAGYHYYDAGVLPLGTTTGTSHTYTGLSCGNSYVVGVDAYDAAGNVSPESTVTLTTTACDAFPPTASITSPVGGATVSGTIQITAGVSDNIGVVGVQFKLDGANLGAEVTTWPYAITWNTTTVPAGGHTLAAVARDAAGNTAASAPVTVIVNNTAAPVTLDKQVTTHQSTKSSSITSPAITTAGPNELMAAFITSDGPAKSRGESFSSVTGGNRTWTLRQRVNTRYGTSEIWTAPAPSVVSNMTVTATRPSGPYVGSITLAAFRNASINAIGAVGGASATSGAPSASLTATKTGSIVWGVGNDWDNALGRTLGPGQTMVDQFLASTGDTFWVQQITTPSTAGQTMTVSDTGPTSDQWNLATIEILPAN